MFHILLVSSSSLSDLEMLLKHYESAPPDSIGEMAKSIIRLIEEKKSFILPLTATAEKPIQIGGTIRRLSERSLTEEDISKFAQEIAIEDLFIRTYYIDHR